MEKNSHCSYCGTKYGSIPYSTLSWPRHCYNCGNTTWQNPLPVTVLIVPVDDGLLTVRRAIPPHVGELAFPGGYLDMYETWQEGAARELFEETGLQVKQPKQISFVGLETSPANSNLLIFVKTPHFKLEDLNFVPNDEVSELFIMKDNSTQLCFPTHQNYAEWFFQGAL